MPNLLRSEDQGPVGPVDPEAIHPDVTDADDDDRRTAPAAERLFAQLAHPWDVQLHALELASAELAVVVRESRRLAALRGRMLRARRTQQLAEQDLDHLQKERATAVSRAGQGLDGASRRERRRVDLAREEAGTLHDARVATTKRITTGRLQAATKQIADLRAEEAVLSRSPLVVDPSLLAWVEDTAAAVAATIDRDREAREQTLEPWTRLRVVDQRIVQALRRAVNGDVLPGQAYGEGPIHLVVGSRLAIVELRQGRDGSVALDEGEDGVDRLWQIRPVGDVPLGLTDGTIAPLLAAADAVEAAIGRRPPTIICISGWSREPDVLDGLHLCGPVSLDGVVEGLDEDPVSREDLRAAASALAQLPLPEVADVAVASLAHVATIHVEDVPEGLPATRDLVVFAHERRHAEA